MRMINGIVYSIICVLFFVWIGVRKKEEKELPAVVLYMKNHLYILAVLLLANSVSFGMTFWEENSQIYIEKEGYGGNEQQVDFLLKKEENTEQVTLEVQPRKLTKEEQGKKAEEAFSYLEEHMKGENKSLSEVKRNLDFSINYEKYPFDAEFQPEDYVLIDGQGNLKNEKAQLLEAGYGQEDLEKGIPTRITVSLWYGKDCEKREYDIILFPKEESEIEKQFSAVLDYLKRKEQEAVYQEGFTLPADVDGVKITKMGKGGVTPFGVLLFGFILAGLLLFQERENVKKQEDNRREMLLRCYPWFVNELVLLLGAGMQVKNILSVLLEECEKEQPRKEREKRKSPKKTEDDYRTPLMKELKVARHSLELGMSEEQVYYQLGRRLKLPCYIKLMTLLEQNVRRGARGLTEVFEQEEFAALEERKNLARRYGEEAGTKLLGPMILLLLVIMLMIMIPAFLSFM